MLDEGFIRRNLASFVIVVVTLSGAFLWIWNEHKQISKDAVEFEKYKAEASSGLSTRKSELDTREGLLVQREKMVEQTLGDLQKSIAAYTAALRDVRAMQEILSEQGRAKAAEEKLHQLMSEFSSMGIDLNSRIKCDDLAGHEKFNRARSKFLEISAIAQAYGFQQRYRDFLDQNAPKVQLGCI